MLYANSEKGAPCKPAMAELEKEVEKGSRGSNSMVVNPGGDSSCPTQITGNNTNVIVLSNDLDPRAKKSKSRPRKQRLACRKA